MQFRFSPLSCTTVKQQHSDIGAFCTLNFSAAGCECIHLTRVHIHCCTGILLIFARTYGCTCNGAKQIKNKVSLQVQPW